MIEPISLGDCLLIDDGDWASLDFVTMGKRLASQDSCQPQNIS